MLRKLESGMTVNRLRKQTSNTEVASLAKKLIKGWKKMLEGKSLLVVIVSATKHVIH